MTDYRWNQLDNARGYDAAAEILHPYYREIQKVILEHLPFGHEDAGTVVDLGGGSGRLAERILQHYPRARVWVIDQSPPFLTLAQERLQRFSSRVVCVLQRLQNAWQAHVNESPQAIISMSAIHHLDATEKQQLYQQCADCLAPGGVLMNGDEVRPEDDGDYLALCRRWAEYMHRQMDKGRVPASLHDALLGWEARNVVQFGAPRGSGDDCHETAHAHLEYFRLSGLDDAAVVWRKDLWSVLFGRKPS